MGPGLGQAARPIGSNSRMVRKEPLRIRAEQWNRELSSCLLVGREEQIAVHQAYLAEASDTEVRWLVKRYGMAFSRAHILSVLGSLYLSGDQYQAAEKAFTRLLRMRHSPFPRTKTKYLQFLAQEGRRHLWLWQMTEIELDDTHRKLIELIDREEPDDWLPHLQYKIAVCLFRLGRHKAFFHYADPLFGEDSIEFSAFMSHAPRFRESCYLLMICAKLEAGYPKQAFEWLERLRVCAPLSEYFNTGSRLLETWGN